MRFPENDIISLLDERLEYNIAESTNRDLLLSDIWDDDFEQALKSTKLEYGTSQGNPLLRTLIAEKLSVDRENVLVTNGSAFAIYLAILSLCSQGDEVLTVIPNFPPTIDLIEGLGFRKKLLRLEFHQQYQLDIDKLFEKITSETRLIILVSPLNPTGTIIEQSIIKQVAERLADEFPDSYLLIDETYREATYYGREPISSSADLLENVITISSLSKCHGTPGIRIGWLYNSDRKLIQAMSFAKMNTVISNSVIDEVVAIQVLKKEKEIFSVRKMHALKGFQVTKAWVNENTRYINWIEPRAGALCCIQLDRKIFSDDKIDEFYLLAEKENIHLANGEWFGETKRHFRLGFGYMEIDKLRHTLKLLTRIIRDLA